MSEQKKSEHLDELLDSLLAGYSDAEPRPGMQTRVLAGLRAEAEPSRKMQGWSWQWLAAGGGTIAFIAAVFAVYIAQIPPLPSLPRIAAAGVPVLAPRPAVKKSAEPTKQRPAQREPEPERVAGVRQEVFPARTPLSEQERLLLRYLADTPREEVASHSHSDEPAEPLVPLGPQSQQLNEIEAQGTR